METAAILPLLAQFHRCSWALLVNRVLKHLSLSPMQPSAHVQLRLSSCALHLGVSLPSWL